MTVSFPSGVPAAAENDSFVVAISFSDGTTVTRTISLVIGDTTDTVAAKIHAAFGQSVPQLTTSVTNNVITFTPTGVDMATFFTTASQSAGSRGGWIFVNRESWVKDLRADPDQATDQQTGDLQTTIEANGKELKVYEDGAWHTVFSEEDVKAWIAAGSQFQGTVEEPLHGVAGAIDLDLMPAETSLTLGEKAHYWIWVGSPAHTIAAGSIGGAPSAIDGAALSVGDWIIVAETQAGSGTFEYRVIPGDLMSRSVARQMFSMQTYVAGAWPQDSVVVYQGDVYRAPTAVTANDPAPDDATSPWVKVDISGGLKVAGDDSQLPVAGAPAGQVWIVLSSATAGGEQALYGFDQGTGQWQQLGGGGMPLDLGTNEELIGVGLPVGSVIAYAGPSAPDGWLFCDGSSFVQATYPELYAALGNRTTTPDLRDYFIRGGEFHDDSYSHHQDTTRKPRSDFRTTMHGNHRHYARIGGGSSDAGWLSGNAFLLSNQYQDGTHDDGKNDVYTNYQGDHDHVIQSGGDAETAPKHVIMAYIVKACDRTVRIRQ